MFSIQQATPNYLNKIYFIMLDWAQSEGIEHKIRITQSQLGDRLFCNEPNHFSALALRDDEVVGWILFNFTTDNMCINVEHGLFIEAMYVLPTFRQHKIGSALFAYVLDVAKKNHCSRIEGWVAKSNTLAVNFYQKRGAIPLEKLSIFKLELQ